MQTSEGALPITALPALPVGLSVVQIPGGEYGKHLKMLYLNINLRRYVESRLDYISLLIRL
jgi:hypothetical protein